MWVLGWRRAAPQRSRRWSRSCEFSVMLGASSRMNGALESVRIEGGAKQRNGDRREPRQAASRSCQPSAPWTGAVQGPRQRRTIPPTQKRRRRARNAAPAPTTSRLSSSRPAGEALGRSGLLQAEPMRSAIGSCTQPCTRVAAVGGADVTIVAVTRRPIHAGPGSHKFRRRCRDRRRDTGDRSLGKSIQGSGPTPRYRTRPSSQIPVPRSRHSVVSFASTGQAALAPSQ